MPAKLQGSLLYVLSGAAIGTLIAIFTTSPMVGILVGVLVGTRGVKPENLRAGSINGLLLGALIGCSVILFSLISSKTGIDTQVIIGSLFRFVMAGVVYGAGAYWLFRWLGNTPFFL